MPVIQFFEGHLTQISEVQAAGRRSDPVRPVSVTAIPARQRSIRM
jgi:hypothetical protein